MDYSMLIILLVGLCVVGGSFAFFYFKRKYNIPNEKIIDGVNTSKDVLEFVKSILRQMNFGKEDDIEKVSIIIIESLNYIKDISEDNVTKRDKILKGTEYSIKLCKELGIEVNKDRICILSNVITLSYNMIEAIDEKKTLENK